MTAPWRRDFTTPLHWWGNGTSRSKPANSRSRLERCEARYQPRQSGPRTSAPNHSRRPQKGRLLIFSPSENAMSWSTWIAESYLPSYKPNWMCVWVTVLILPIRKSEDGKADPGPHCILGDQGFHSLTVDLQRRWSRSCKWLSALGSHIPPSSGHLCLSHTTGPGYTPTAYTDGRVWCPTVSPDDSHTYQLHRALVENEPELVSNDFFLLTAFRLFSWFKGVLGFCFVLFFPRVFLISHYSW